MLGKEGRIRQCTQNGRHPPGLKASPQEASALTARPRGEFRVSSPNTPSGQVRAEPFYSLFTWGRTSWDSPGMAYTLPRSLLCPTPNGIRRTPVRSAILFLFELICMSSLPLASRRFISLSLVFFWDGAGNPISQLVGSWLPIEHPRPITIYSYFIDFFFLSISRSEICLFCGPVPGP